MAMQREKFRGFAKEGIGIRQAIAEEKGISRIQDNHGHVTQSRVMITSSLFSLIVFGPQRAAPQRHIYAIESDSIYTVKATNMYRERSQSAQGHQFPVQVVDSVKHLYLGESRNTELDSSSCPHHLNTRANTPEVTGIHNRFSS